MKKRIILAISLAGLIIMWLISIPDDKVRVIFCDVGQGDGIIIIQGQLQMIIDSGPDNGRMGECLSRYLPFWDKTIEMAIISHWDSDHSGGLKKLLKSYQIEKILSGSLPVSGPEIKYPVILTVSGDTIRVKKMTFKILWPKKGMISGDTNLESVVALWQYGNNKILFSGDAPGEVEEELVWRGRLKEDNLILKVSHHGSRGATGDVLLGAVKPRTAIISVGRRNKFGHPGKEVLERLQKYGAAVRRTDKEGDIEIKYD